MSIREWSITASGNSNVAGINFAEGQAANTLNNSNREAMAQIRQQYAPDEWGWVGLPASYSLSITNQTRLKFNGDRTADFEPYRRFRLSGGSTVVEGYITSSSYTTETTVTLTKDSGSISSSHSIIELSAVYGKVLPGNIPTNDGAETFNGTLTVKSSDAGAAAGPTLKLHRDSASPADDDVLGEIDFDGEDSADNQTTYARIVAAAVDVTDGTEDGRLTFRTMIAGSITSIMSLDQGVYTAGATGGDKGQNTVNANDYYVGGVAMPRLVIKSANENLSTDTTQQADDELLFAMAANTKYHARWVVLYSTPAAADFKFSIDSTGATDPSPVSVTCNWVAPDGTVGGDSQSSLNNQVSITSASGTEGRVEIVVYADNGADAGNLRLMWSQASSSGTTTVRRGSLLEYRVV